MDRMERAPPRVLGQLRSELFLAAYGSLVLLAGLAVNAVQLLSLLVLWPINRNLYRSLNANLVTTYWTFLIFLAERWAGVRLRIFGDPKVIATLGQHKAIAILNHASDLDWLFGWLIADKFHYTKCLLKSSLRFMPVIGWSFWFVEYIFLQRSWESDQKHMSTCFRQLDDFPYPYWMVIFCEGTRITPEKHAASVKFCEANGLRVFKHILYPRLKGFQLMVDELKGIEHVLDVTFAFPQGVPSLTDVVVDGRKFEVHVNIGRSDFSEVPKDAEGCGRWCVDKYGEMDQRLEYHAQHKTFQGKGTLYDARPLSVICVVSWALLILGMLAWVLVPSVVAGSYHWVWAIVIVYFLGFVMVRLGLWFGKKKKPSKQKKEQ